jgi:hypothetical protein
VYRVTNVEVHQNIGSVLDGIHAVIMERVAKGPHPAQVRHLLHEVEKEQK